jgi:hypothetical protein
LAIKNPNDDQLCVTKLPDAATINTNVKEWIMNIDRMEFLSWMERILERFDLMSEHISGLEKKRGNVDGEELLDNQDLLQMLKISTRSLQRYRSSGKLPYYTISGKIYYKLSDVHQFIRDSFSARMPKTQAIE